MKKTSGFVTKEQAHLLIEKHKGIIEQRIYAHGDIKNNHMDYHHCILWGDYFEETDHYGNKSWNKLVVDEFRWQERTPDWILKMHNSFGWCNSLRLMP